MLLQVPESALGLRVFISYSRRNQAFVEAMHAHLSACGATPHADRALIDLWYDQRSIPIGEDWKAVLIDGLLTTDLVMLFVSPNSMQSEYVRQEIALARQHAIPVVPVVYRAVADDPASLPGEAWDFYTSVRRIQWIDLDGIEPPYTAHTNFDLLEAGLEEAWRVKIDRLIGPAPDAKTEQSVICALYKTDHPWAVRYLDRQIETLMRLSPPNPLRAQYYAHALACIQAQNGPATWQARINWWRAEIPPAYTQLLEYAARHPIPPG